MIEQWLRGAGVEGKLVAPAVFHGSPL
jgi:hypothetical protein